jgi:hypothetical protein
MKKILTNVLTFASLVVGFAQTNDSQLSAYKWKGKKTELQDGYVVYYRETVVINKTSGEKFILYNHKSTADDQLEGLLMGCYTFLSLEKSAQKEYYKLKNIKETVKMLDECY